MENLLKRPRTFDDVIGQNSVVKEMKKYSKEYINNRNSFPKSMIFSGPTGTGKTSTALILASMVNCKNPLIDEDKVSPCLECDSCIDIISESFSRDVHMLDASSMGKDDVLKIENTARILPMHDNKRIIIIDEAQELSSKAKGATLKIIEKERSHVHFILCTMDEAKIEKAVLSRSSFYRFFPLSDEIIAEHLFSIIKEKGAQVPNEFLKDGIFLISEYSEGSVRLGVRNLERCINSEIFNAEEIKKELGSYTPGTLNSIAIKLVKYDTSVLADIMNGEEEALANTLYYYLVQAKISSMHPDMNISDKRRSDYAFLMKHDSFNDLLESVSMAFQLPYFRKTVFLHHIVSYLTKGIEPPILHKNPATPKRVVGRKLVER